MEEQRKLIDFEKARKSVMEILAGKVTTPIAVKVAMVMQEQSVDAAEVVHGRWIVDAVEVDHPFLEFESVWRDVHQCSICKEYFDVSDARNYCPNCGADMRGTTDGKE